MTKVQKISKNITPFAGVFFANEEFNNSGLRQLIDKQLGSRASTKGYSYGNLFGNFFNLFLSGGECVEDIQQHFRSTLAQIPGNEVASPDTLLRVFGELATENTVVVSSSEKEYQFNINEKLNDLNIKSLLLTKQLKEGQFYDFDYDNQIIEHEKFDAKKTYKMNEGYFPGAGTIGDKIVYIENRDGNANVKTAQAETLKRNFKLLKNNKIHINRSRMDAGSYSEEIIKAVDKYSRLFYIRANKCESLTEEIRKITDWQLVEINYKEYQVASVPFTRFLADRNYRLVIMREKTNDPQLDLFEGEKFNYRYYDLMATLIGDWRKFWGEDLPFIGVQLANFLKPELLQQQSNWAELREVQRKLYQTFPNTGMAVAIDLGEWNDIHPLNKKDVGKRLALKALSLAYGEKIVCDGPVYQSNLTDGNRMILSFKADTDHLMPENELKGFTIAGSDGIFKPAQAIIDNKRVIVWNNEITQLVKVRYAELIL